MLSSSLQHLPALLCLLVGLGGGAGGDDHEHDDNDDDVHGDNGDDDALFFPLLGLGLNINGQEMT